MVLYIQKDCVKKLHSGRLFHYFVHVLRVSSAVSLWSILFKSSASFEESSMVKDLEKSGWQASKKFGNLISSSSMFLAY